MASRIDGVKVSLSVYDEFEGTRIVAFAVPPPFSEQLLDALMLEWHAYTARLIAAATANPGGDLLG